MTLLYDNIREQLEATYRAMAAEARYRPVAPGDGFGNITRQELDLDAEATEYARKWWEEEDDLSFLIGCCNFDTRPATVYAIEAARLMCAGIPGNRTALRLLRMAVTEMEAQPEELE